MSTMHTEAVDIVGFVPTAQHHHRVPSGTVLHDVLVQSFTDGAVGLNLLPAATGWRFHWQDNAGTSVDRDLPGARQVTLIALIAATLDDAAEQALFALHPTDLDFLIEIDLAAESSRESQVRRVRLTYTAARNQLMFRFLPEP